MERSAMLSMAKSTIYFDWAMAHGFHFLRRYESPAGATGALVLHRTHGLGDGMDWDGMDWVTNPQVFMGFSWVFTPGDVRL
jgi:hypothetical protein